MKIAIVVGEYSGDSIAARLVEKLVLRFPQCEIYGTTGPKLRALPVTSIANMEDICVMGISEVIKHLPKILQVRRTLKQYLTQHPPDVYIGIDAPDFNLPVEKYLKTKLGVLTVHYCSPSVWAWRKNRVYGIAKAVDLLLCLFPFEPAYYQGLAVTAQFIGHPLVDEIVAIRKNKQEARALLNLDVPENVKVIALMPGSRRAEIDSLAELFLTVASTCWEQNQKLIFILPAINDAIAAQLKLLVEKINPNLPILIKTQVSREMIAASDLVLLASGTATLEVMLIGRPMIVAYKISTLSYSIAKHLVKIPYISLPNIIAGEALVPEFIQEQATVENLTQAVKQYLQHDMTTVLQKFQKISEQFAQNSIENAVHAIANALETRRKMEHKQ